MLNQIILVGRLTKNVELNEIDNKKQAVITLAVNRAFKNEEGIYETDFIPVMLWNGVAEQTAEYLKKGDLLGVKGRIESNENKIIINAEKVTFLSSKSKEDKEENENDNTNV